MRNKRVCWQETKVLPVLFIKLTGVYDVYREVDFLYWTLEWLIKSQVTWTCRTPSCARVGLVRCVAREQKDSKIHRGRSWARRIQFFPAISPDPKEALLGWDGRVLNLLTNVFITHKYLWNVSNSTISLKCIYITTSINNSFYLLYSLFLFLIHCLRNLLFSILSLLWAMLK